MKSLTFTKNKIAIAGAGLSGAVLARQIAENSDFKVVVFEGRDHIGGNCHTDKDPETGIMVHKYGPHIFHTNFSEVWKFVSRFSKFYPYIHKVNACTRKGIFTLPINLSTINDFFGKSFTSDEAKAFIKSVADKSIGEPKNFEELALKTIGHQLYENFYYGYTKKQWGIEPREIPASVFKRLPVRFNKNASYFNSKYQGIPTEGYTVMIGRILDHPQIEVLMNTEIEPKEGRDYCHLFWTGTLDSFFNYKYGKLGYRTSFWLDGYAQGDWQAIPQVNYTDVGIPHTRVIEPKFFTPWKRFRSTIYQTELSKATAPGDIPCYPTRFKSDIEMLSMYRELALNTDGVSFLGRLGTYSYLDMDQAVEQAIVLAENALPSLLDNGRRLPTFPKG